MQLKTNERIDDLQYNQLKIIQNSDFFRFGSDAVELANFVSGGSKDRAVDLGSGSGIISILLAGKKNINVTAVEIQTNVAEMSSRSVQLNGLEDKIKVLNIPMQEIGKHLACGSQTIVVSNPPYRKADSGEVSNTDTVAISRHEIKVTLDEVIATASYLLSKGGKFYIVHQCERMAEVIAGCKKHRLEPKVLQILTPDDNKPPHIFLLKCLKDGAEGIEVKKQRKIIAYC
jgi:tRNA1Val (adenine37-N6)-methyltransferase